MWVGKNVSVSLTLDDSDVQFRRISVQFIRVTDAAAFDITVRNASPGECEI